MPPLMLVSNASHTVHSPLWEELHGVAFRVALARLRDAAAAEEVAQETLLRVWRAREQMGGLESVEAWVVRITQREVLRYVERRDRTSDRELLGELDEQLGRADVGADERLAVRGTVRGLGELDRQIVGLHYWADVPLPEVAAALGMPLGSVKARVHRARAKLAGELADLTIAA